MSHLRETGPGCQGELRGWITVECVPGHITHPGSFLFVTLCTVFVGWNKIKHILQSYITENFAVQGRKGRSGSRLGLEGVWMQRTFRKQVPCVGG